MNCKPKELNSIQDECKNNGCCDCPYFYTDMCISTGGHPTRWDLPKTDEKCRLLHKNKKVVRR